MKIKLIGIDGLCSVPRHIFALINYYLLTKKMKSKITRQDLKIIFIEESRQFSSQQNVEKSQFDVLQVISSHCK